eukprot:TRINITY_DN29755_c0_g1_i1.p1 TRINITY_DN29755_c0_g1~~TRINITY_DN29755_c0_g1_i1.p1  ORF type:complete len:455 (-),score=65.43 TRINITY_DN29755_c0_g1_i1:332-1696(-)
MPARLRGVRIKRLLSRSTCCRGALQDASVDVACARRQHAPVASNGVRSLQAKTMLRSPEAPHRAAEGRGAPPRSRRDFAAPAAATSGDDKVTISRARLDELLRAEVAHLVTAPVTRLSMRDILNHSDAHDLAKLMKQELPKRYAMRIRMIEGLYGWDQIEELRNLHGMLHRWYSLIAMIPQTIDLHNFSSCVNALYTEGKKVVPMLAAGLRKLRRSAGAEYDDDYLNRWADGYLLSRLVCAMLLHQYRSILPVEFGGRICRPTGVITTDCDVTSICKLAAEEAQRLSLTYLGRAPSFTIENYVGGKSGPQPAGSCHFSFIPGYLRYIVLELMKNSFHATVKNSGSDTELAEVRILICCDAHRVVIRISDRGGGIPFEVGDKIWSYMYGATAGKNAPEATPLAGHGVGLPLSRLHALCFNGKLHITTYPGYGTDAHLLLPRFEADQVEKMPLDKW